MSNGKTETTTPVTVNALEKAFNTYVKLFGPDGQDAWRASAKSPKDEALKAEFQAKYTPEAREAWKVYEGLRVQYKAENGVKAPSFRFPTLAAEAPTAIKTTAKAAA